MTNSLMQWHLARDNQEKLAKFCEKHRVKQYVTKKYRYSDTEGYFVLHFDFDNGSFIEAELRAGDVKGYSVNDHFQVVDYKFA